MEGGGNFTLKTMSRRVKTLLKVYEYNISNGSGNGERKQSNGHKREDGGKGIKHYQN